MPTPPRGSPRRQEGPWLTQEGLIAPAALGPACPPPSRQRGHPCSPLHSVQPAGTTAHRLLALELLTSAFYTKTTGCIRASLF